MSILLRALSGASGNRVAQQVLLRNMQITQFLMGIGSGAGVGVSGERASLERMLASKRDRYCVFDVGANKGQFLRLTLDTVRTGGLTVHSFEPGRETFALLKRAAEGDPRVRLNNFALGRHEGEATLHYDKVGSGMASLTKRRLDYAGVEFELEERVRIATIDEYCASNGVERIDLLKIDIEGHELDALSGASGLFERRAIESVAFEFGGCNIDTRTYFQDFWYFFRDRGMEILRITPSGYLHPVGRYRESFEQFKTTNFLAVNRV